jgi:hypothetical protein
MPLLQVSVKVSMPAAVGVTVMLPLAACIPFHAPLAVQFVPAVAVHIKVAARPAITDVGLTLIETEVGVMGPDGA